MLDTMAEVCSLVPNDGELIAAQSADKIGLPNALLETRRDLGEQSVASGAAKGVVDILEAVEVEREHGHQMPMTLGPCHRAIEML
jgi:hypothetical protein